MKIQILIKSVLFILCIYSISISAQNIEKPEDIIFLDQQMAILKIDTCKANVDRMQRLFEKQSEIKKGFLSDFLDDVPKFDTLRITKLFRAMYLNNYDEVIDVSKKIYLRGIIEIDRLVAFSKTIAYAHLNKPNESMLVFNSKIIQESLQCQSVIYVHGKNNNLNFNDMNVLFLKKKRRENNRESFFLLGIAGGTVAATLAGIYFISYALKDWDIR